MDGRENWGRAHVPVSRKGSETPSAECSAPRQLVRCGLRGIGFMSPGSLSKIEPGHLPSSGSYMKGEPTGLVLFSVKILLEDQ